MRCEKRGRELENGAKYCSGTAVPEQTERKWHPVRFRASLVFAFAAVVIALVLTGCGKKERFPSPLEYYRHVETAAVETMIERFDESYDGALRAVSDVSGRKFKTETTLELFKPAADMLQTYTGMDFSWLKSLGFTADVNLAEGGAAADLSLSLNGRELIGAEMLADYTLGTLYSRVPLLSEEYFYTDALDLRYLTSTRKLQDAMFDALPDAEVFTELLSRCAEAALECVGDVKQGSDTLSAGGVSAKYTTLTVTLAEDDLRDMAEGVCDVLREDEDFEDFILKLEDLSGAAFYDYFLDALEELPDRVELNDDTVVMTVYVDEDDVIHGRVIEYGDYILRCAMPEDRGAFGFELSLEDAEEREILWSVSGDGERDDDTLNGTLVLEFDETELFTILIEDLDMERTNNGMHLGKVTVRPTYEYYTYFGVYSLTARALEDFSYALKVGEEDIAFEVNMDDDPFLTLTLRAENGPAEDLPTADSASDIDRWSMSVLLSGGLESYMNYLKESDIPQELLQQLLGVLF